MTTAAIPPALAGIPVHTNSLLDPNAVIVCGDKAKHEIDGIIVRDKQTAERMVEALRGGDAGGLTVRWCPTLRELTDFVTRPFRL